MKIIKKIMRLFFQPAKEKNGKIYYRIFGIKIDATSSKIHKQVLNFLQRPVVKLHLGCGTIYKDGWINVDNNTDNNIQKLDLNWDLRYALPFPDNSVDFIFNEHFLEHLNVADGQKSLRDFIRVLKPGGVMRIAMPDLQWIVSAYNDDNWKETFSGFIKKYNLDFVKTKAEFINMNFRNYGHQWLYDWQELERRLIDAGATKIKQCKIFKSNYNELKNIEIREESILIAEITK